MGIINAQTRRSLCDENDELIQYFKARREMMFLLLRVHVLANQSYTKQCNTGDDNEI